MDNGNNSTMLALTLLLGIFLQVLFVFADNVNTPGKTAAEFSKAYFKLDPSMSKYLCSELTEGENGDAVERYLETAAMEAKNRGFKTSYVKSYIYEITTNTISKDTANAQVKIHFKRRKSINPVFAIIAKLFFIGGTYTVDEVIDMVKEDGKWKICNKPFSLT